MKRDRKPKSLERGTLYRLVADHLDIAEMRCRGGKPQKIVNAIFNSMAAALQRGERIVIPGFGVFYLGKDYAHRRYTYWWKDGTPVTVKEPAGKPIVRFRPSALLVNLLNQKDPPCS